MRAFFIVRADHSSHGNFYSWGQQSFANHHNIFVIKDKASEGPTILDAAILSPLPTNLGQNVAQRVWMDCQYRPIPCYCSRIISDAVHDVSILDLRWCGVSRTSFQVLFSLTRCVFSCRFVSVALALLFRSCRQQRATTSSSSARQEEQERRRSSLELHQRLWAERDRHRQAMARQYLLSRQQEGFVPSPPLSVRELVSLMSAQDRESYVDNLLQTEVRTL
jgi:hypothetical protein